MKTKDLTLCTLFTVLLIISSKIVIPTGLIPLTLQTCSMILIALLLHPKQILLTYSLYLTMGLAGLPVFANGGGISYILQPSFGFLLSFPIAAVMISTIAHHFHLHRFITLFPLCLAGIVTVYMIGCAYMYGILNFYMGAQKDIASIIAVGASPFIISDSISAALGCICALRLERIPVIQRVCSK